MAGKPNTQLALNGFDMTPTGIVAKKGATIDEWKAVGEFLKRAEGAVQWWIGDWLNFGEGRPQWGQRPVLSPVEGLSCGDRPAEGSGW